MQTEHMGCKANWFFSFVAATPKQIREKMQVDGLTNDEVKSHLQVSNSIFYIKYQTIHDSLISLSI